MILFVVEIHIIQKMFIKRLIAGTKQLASNEINPFIEKTL